MKSEMGTGMISGFMVYGLGRYNHKALALSNLVFMRDQNQRISCS